MAAHPCAAEPLNLFRGSLVKTLSQDRLNNCQGKGEITGLKNYERSEFYL